nr:radical SAM protein [Chrysiogenes arsenatis]
MTKIEQARALYSCKKALHVKAAVSREKALTKRGVLWLGQTCNLRCFFCYFVDKIADKHHPEHPFMDLEKAKRICRALRTVYGNTSVDIQGGEPTIYPQIFELVGYCASIGLKPTLITNAIVLSNISLCEQFLCAGVHDFLVSVHGLGDVYEKVVGLPGGSEKQMRALYNLQTLGIPFRLNCTLTKEVVHELEDIVTLAKETGARVVNFIAFNPFADQQDKNVRNSENVPSYHTIKAKLTSAIDQLEWCGIETNVRYLPLCIAEERHRKNFYNFQQLSYDPREWDFNSWTWTTRLNQRSSTPELDEPIPILLYDIYEYNDIAFGDTARHGTKAHYMREIDVREHLLKLFSADISKDLLYRQNARLRAEKHCKYEYNQTCHTCSLRLICDGFHNDYASIFGTSEACAILGELIDDPTYFIQHQEKIVE